MGNATSSDASDEDGGMSGMNLGLQNLNLGDQPRSRPLDLPGNLFGKDDEGTRKEGERAEQWESSSNTSRDGKRGHQGEREQAAERDGGHGGGGGRHISFQNFANEPRQPADSFEKEEDAKGGWPANNLAEKKKRVEPSELQLKLLEDLKQENKRLLQLKDHYRLRMASASPAHFHSIKLQRKLSMPRFEATEDGILIDSQIDKTLPVVLEDFKLNSKQKNSSGVVGMLTVRNCASSVETGATVSCIRTLGEVKRFIIEDCQHYLIVIDGVTDTCTISNSSNLTVVIGGNLPSIVLTKCKNISFVSAVRNYGEHGRKYELCMSACSGIVTQLLTDSIISEKGLSHEDLKTGITIMRYRDDARTVHLPDTVEATVKSNSLNCVLRAMAKINDESIPWVEDTIVEFANVYRGHKLSEAQVGMPDREVCVCARAQPLFSQHSHLT